MLATFESGDAFAAILEFFFLVIWFWLLITVFADLFRDHSISGWAKAAWILFVVVIPYFGVLVYFIARGHGMRDRAIAQQKDAQQAFQQYVQQTASTDSPADQLKILGDLHDAGKLSDEEFAAQKAKVLAS
jgi:uncharacterized membrane protein YhaH (DUF805 family)